MMSISAPSAPPTSSTPISRPEPPPGAGNLPAPVGYVGEAPGSGSTPGPAQPTDPPPTVNGGGLIDRIRNAEVFGRSGDQLLRMAVAGGIGGTAGWMLFGPVGGAIGAAGGVALMHGWQRSWGT